MDGAACVTISGMGFLTPKWARNGAGRLGLALCLLGGVGLNIHPPVAAAISSTNYQIQEDFLGGNGGVVNATSANYQARDSLGALGAGDSSSTNYRTQSGATTTNDPALTFSMDTANIDFGTLSTATTATGTAQFSVTNYTSYGYTVQMHYASASNVALDTSYPLYSSGLQYFFATPSAPTASAAGTEQFGFNVVANTSPATFGANPQQVPDSSFSYGAAASAYNQANQYNFPNPLSSSGDTLAQATQSSGKTIYAMAFIANISSSTPASTYSAQQELVCIGTY